MPIVVFDPVIKTVNVVKIWGVFDEKCTTVSYVRVVNLLLMIQQHK